MFLFAPITCLFTATTVQALRKRVGLPEDYTADGFLVAGTWDLFGGTGLAFKNVRFGAVTNDRFEIENATIWVGSNYLAPQSIDAIKQEAASRRQELYHTAAATGLLK